MALHLDEAFQTLLLARLDVAHRRSFERSCDHFIAADLLLFGCRNDVFDTLVANTSLRDVDDSSESSWGQPQPRVQTQETYVRV
jgi:hypothetical protein